MTPLASDMDLISRYTTSDRARFVSLAHCLRHYIVAYAATLPYVQLVHCMQLVDVSRHQIFEVQVGLSSEWSVWGIHALKLRPADLHTSQSLATAAHAHRPDNASSGL